MSITSALTSPPMPDTRRPDLRSTSADSVLRAASRTGNPARRARAAIVPPNAPMPTISICIFWSLQYPAMRLNPASCLKNRALSPPLPATGVTFDLFWRRHVLGIAVTKGPIFLQDFNKVDEDIFLANLYSFVEMVR